ncbi:STAS domain-containing protein [Streptomyces galbus]|uniref:Anti-sigma factor antagonist n=1 Tax=Streptomyces galbus TaxID=33898 RepID=A0A4U5WXK3_STRGB|nr:STAS domain-containing protein [Streptomyces galbus]TKT06632.1 STAS domain-containing protein [Streptomyces galbus]GHD53584.1 anti-sigma factor antagonist [Streptomyces galbus]
MTTEPSVSASTSGPCLIVQVSGNMDYADAPFFRHRLAQEVTQGHPFVVLDLSAVAFVDSSGLNALLWAWRRAESVGTLLVLACVPPKLQRMLAMTQVDTVLQVYGTTAQAEAELTSTRGA